jgi:hypothetical protein
LLLQQGSGQAERPPRVAEAGDIAHRGPGCPVGIGGDGR